MKIFTFEDRNNISRTKRLRKKLKVKEFTQYGFYFKAELQKGFSKQDIDTIFSFAEIHDFKILDSKLKKYNYKFGKKNKKVTKFEAHVDISKDHCDILHDENNFLKILIAALPIDSIEYSNNYDLNHENYKELISFV